MLSRLTTPPDPACGLCGRPKAEHVHAWSCPGRPDRYFRRRDEDMPGLGIAPHPDVPLGVYLHLKSGRRYRVLGGAFAAEVCDRPDEIRVLYRAVDGEHPYLAVRSVGDFLATIPTGPLAGRRRFDPVPDDGEDHETSH